MVLGIFEAGLKESNRRRPSRMLVYISEKEECLTYEKTTEEILNF